MNDYINELSENLELVSTEKNKNGYVFLVESKLKSVECPYCGSSSSKCHSKYYKTFDDIPLNGKRVTIKIRNRKMFCQNPDCDHKTFSETFDFVARHAKRTKRLDDYVLDISKNISSLNAEKTLKKNGIKIGKSTICTFLKKR